MNLLRQIQDEATKSDSNVLVLLRKCSVLASRLKHGELKTWVDSELNGYKEGMGLPDYRVAIGASKGYFTGYGRILNNADIPPMCVPKEYRDVIREVKLREGIGSYCDLLSNDDTGIFKNEWPADLTAMMGRRIYDHMNMLNAWIEIPRGVIVNVVESVKTRILTFVLDLESEDPNAGEAVGGGSTLSPEKITQIFNTNIFGTVGNLATGSTHFSQKSSAVISTGNFLEMERFLKEQGVSGEDTKELKAAIKADGEVSPEKRAFGRQVSNWLGKMVGKAASGAWRVTTDVAASITTEALKRYYGLGE